MTEPAWDLWRAFCAVMETGTLSGAARALGLTQPTIGRQIEALEQALGYPLFVRSQRGLAATDAAHALAPLAADMAATAGALTRAGAGAASEHKGVVRLTAAKVMAAEVIPSMLTRFRALYPDIEIELSASNVVEDLLTREADLAVRTADPTQLALIAKKIGVSPINLYAHEDYLARFGAPETVEDLSRHTLIGYDKQPALREFLSSLGVDPARALFAIRTDDEMTQHGLLRAGIGIGGMQRALAARSPELRPVLHDAIHLPMPVWVVMHEDLRASRSVRALFDHLTAEFAAYLA
jgi:DNA-binding transcriptional LysR family regulator